MIRDFAERTRINLRAIERLRNEGQKVYEVTQLAGPVCEHLRQLDGRGLTAVMIKDVHGQNHLEHLLLSYSGKHLRTPQPGEQVPDHRYLEWHQREVFWAPARSFAACLIE